MNWLQLIERRVSVRKYEPDVDEVTLAQVRRFCEHVKERNSQEVEFYLVPSSEVSKGGFWEGPSAPWYVAAVAPDDRDSLLSLGYSGEQLVLQMTSLELGTCWQGAFFDREALGRSLNLGKGLGVRALLAWGRSQNDSKDHPRIKKRLMPDKLVASAEVNYPWRTVLEAVRWAPSALNRQPWRLWFEEKAIHLYSRNTRIARFLTPIDMGIALCHLELACGQLGIPGSIEAAEHPRRKGWEYWISYQIK